ncbi:MAG: penicillin-binding protein, partial [Sphingomonadales bacterium]
MDKRGGRRAQAARGQRRDDGDGGGRGFGFWVKRLVIWGGALALLGALFLGIAVAFAARSLPSFYQLKATQAGQTIVVRARDGSEIAELGPNYGEWVPFAEIPQAMRDAMVAVEDRRFYMHPGVDPLGLARAVYVAFTGDRRVSATSTITQQLARNVFLNSNRSLDRKLREGVLALALEAKFSKEQILELYLNKVYFGGGAYGIDSASRTFFSHPGTKLSVAEAAIIAGMVKAPSNYSPTADVDAAVGRAEVVLQLMREQGYISASQAQVDPSTVKLKAETSQNSARYFTDWALPQLEMLLPETSEPIEVWTTIDPGMQRAAAAAIKANAPGGALHARIDGGPDL